MIICICDMVLRKHIFNQGKKAIVHKQRTRKICFGVTQLFYERILKIIAFYVLTCATQYNYCTYIELDNIYGGDVIYLQKKISLSCT